jgi:hypothetical protein
LWPPQRGVGLKEPNLGKTNPRVTHFIIRLRFVFAPSLADSFILLTLTRLVVVFIIENFSFALFTPPSRRLSRLSRRAKGPSCKGDPSRFLLARNDLRRKSGHKVM